VHGVRAQSGCALTRSDDGLPDTRPPLLVTASVDAIHLRHPLSMDNDMAVSGRVVWTGKSALDIQMELTQACAQSHAGTRGPRTLALAPLARWRA